MPKYTKEELLTYCNASAIAIAAVAAGRPFKEEVKDKIEISPDDKETVKTLAAKYEQMMSKIIDMINTDSDEKVFELTEKISQDNEAAKQDIEKISNELLMNQLKLYAQKTEDALMIVQSDPTNADELENLTTKIRTSISIILKAV